MSEHPVKSRKKLIEVAIPLEAINAAADQEKRNPFLKGHPRSIHIWFAPRPLPVARAVIFCQCVDDPSDIPEEFPTPEAAEVERKRLFDIIVDILDWDKINDERAFLAANREILRSWERFCRDNPESTSTDIACPPKLLDPFSGGGAIPLEAKRLGMDPIAADLNPVPYLINIAKIEGPSRFNLSSPISRKRSSSQGRIAIEVQGKNHNLKSIADDVRYYSKELGKVVKESLQDYYPLAFMGEGLDSGSLALPVSTYLWARTVESPDPAFSGMHVPLISSFVLSNKKGAEAYLEPSVVSSCNGHWELRIVSEISNDIQYYKNGTKRGRGASFQCILSGAPISPEYIYKEATEGRMRSVLIGVQAVAGKKKIFLPAKNLLPAQECTIEPLAYSSSLEMPDNPRWFSPPLYGIKHFSDLFTERQKLLLLTASNLICEIRKKVINDAIESGLANDSVGFDSAGTGATAYADIISLYLALLIGKMSDYHTTCSTWNPTNQNIGHLFAKNAIPMTWDYPEANPFAGGVSFEAFGEIIAKSIENLPVSRKGKVILSPCQSIREVVKEQVVVSTDPPYYDNIGYADLSDFFYQWLRLPLKSIFGDALGSIASPKSSELVATPYRHGGKKNAEKFFLDGMVEAMRGISAIAHSAYPITIYYAFKQSEKKKGGGIASTGWEIFLGSIINSGLCITGTWPMRTEREARSIGIGTNALASSIVLVCRLRDSDAKSLSRKQFRDELKNALPLSIRELEHANIAPVDVAQAAIGPGMAIFSSARAVLNPDDSLMSVREALIEINAALDEYLSQDEGELDSDSRFALTFFESYGYEERPYGDAEGLAIARNLSVDGVAEAGILSSVAGKVHLYQRAQLPDEWDPTTDRRLCVWEATQHLIKRLEASGEGAAADLLLQLKNVSGRGDLAANCRALAYRLYNHCEKKKQAEEARSYNGLVIAWPELERLASASSTSSFAPRQTTLI
ncbi:MAG: DUF1156 domain-containing protein [Cyanobacteriota bacterium]|jgi:putative DNA methylase